MNEKCKEFLCVRYKYCNFSHHCSAIMCVYRYDKACESCAFRCVCSMQQKRTNSLNSDFANSATDYSQESEV